MDDYLVKSVAENGQFRAYAVTATNLVEQAHEIHDTWSAATAALGRALIGTLLLATAGLQGEAGMTVKIQGNGPVGAIVVDGTAQGTVKGYLTNPHVSLPLNAAGKLDVAGAVGTQGTLSVTKMAPGDKAPYTGEVQLVSGELGEDFTYYLAQSEQIPSAVGLGVFVQPDEQVEVAGGFLIQVLPGASASAIADLEQRLKALPQLTTLLREGKRPEEILKLIFPGDDELKVLAKMPVAYRCDCSRERFAKALAGLKRDELTTMMKEDGGATAVCRFCGKQYHFSKADLAQMVAAKDAAGQPAGGQPD